MPVGTTLVKAPTSRVRLGHARVEITPPVGIYHRMWGAARHDRATGVHRPVYADVLAGGPVTASPDMPRAAPQAQYVRAFLDLVGLARQDHEPMVQAMAEASGLPPEAVVVTHSHSHSAGWLVPDRVALPGGDLIPSYLAELRRRLAGATREALAALQPATISYARGTCHMAANRDYWDAARGAYSCGFNPDAPAGASATDSLGPLADDTLLAARIAGDDGKLVAT